MKPESILKIENEFGIEFKGSYGFFGFEKNEFVFNMQNEIIALKIDEEGELILKILSFLINEIDTIEELSFSNEVDFTFTKSFKNLRKLKVEISSSENLQIISELVQLKELSIDITKDIDLSILKNLKELTSLTISQHVSNIDFLKELTNLKWFNLYPSNLEDLSPISSLDKLEHLWIWGGKFKNINEVGKLKTLKGLVVKSLLIDNPEFIGNLINLETLWLKINGISNISFLKNLKKLKNLDIKTNPINDISFISELEELEYLRIKRTKVSDISPLRYLDKLKNVDLQENEISDITDLLKNKSIKSVNLKGNKKIEIDFPKEVLEAGWEAIKQYSEKSKEKVPFKNVKVLLLGNPNIGKSNLLEYLETNKVPIINDSTHGVRYKQVVLNDINFHIWDFGGQEYFHATHKLFFSSNALNIILWGKDILRNSDKIENQFFNLDYWLRIVEQLNCNSSKEEVLIIENKIDLNIPINQETILNQKELSENYKILNLSFTNFSLLNLKRTEIFKNIFFEKAESIISKFNYPAFYEVFWKRIQELNKDFVNIDEINNRPHKENVIAAIKVFHNMGMLLYFYDLIPDKVFCKPQVLLDLLYEKVLSKEKKDRLTKQEIKESILNNPLDLSLEDVIKLLKHFDLVFEIKDEKDVYFIPQYLKSINPYIKDLKEQIFSGCNIRIYGDNYLMSLAMQKIYSKLGNYVNKDDNEYWFWRNGIIVKKDNSILMIEYNFENQTIELYQDKDCKNFDLQKAVVDYILDLPEEEYFPKRNYSNYIDIVKKRVSSPQNLLSNKIQNDNTISNEDIKEYFAKIEERSHNESYSKGFNWKSKYFTVQVSIDNEYFIDWKTLNESIEIQKVKTFNYDSKEKIENVSSFSKYLNIDKNGMNQESKIEVSKEVKSVTNNFHAPVNIGNLGDNGSIEEFNVVNSETSKSFNKSGLTNDEEKSVKKWKANSTNIFLISLILTFLIVLSYSLEFEFLMRKESWKSFKSTEWFKWIGLVIAFIWNAFVGKMWYDRKFDPSKENSFIDLYRKKNKK